jgi:FkbM family methyltransferase
VKFLKRQTRTILKRAGLYQRLRTSAIHDLYRSVADKRWILARDRQMDSYSRLFPELRHGDLIFDVGANEGFKTDLFLRMGARVVAIEPDETNQLVLQQRFVKFRLARRPVAIIGKAVSDKNTTESMWIDGPGSAVNTLSQKWATTLRGNKARHTDGHCGLDFVQRRTVETTTLEELIAVHGMDAHSSLRSMLGVMS